jgi:hypothetical protein
MLDGQEDPCVPPHFLEAIREKEGRPCPRVELEPGNHAAAELVSLALSDRASLSGVYFEALAEGMDAPGRRATTARVVRAASNRAVAGELKQTGVRD